MKKINLSKIFLVLAIAMFSLNFVFAGSVSKRYRISGDLVIDSALESKCSEGGDWTSGQIIIEQNEFEETTGVVFFNDSSNLNSLFDKLFFAIVSPGEAANLPRPNGCSLEIWSPSGNLIFDKSGLNANAIKSGLNQGILLENVVVEGIDPNTTTLDFSVKIKHSKSNQYLLQTTVKVPNINNKLYIAADNVDALNTITNNQFDIGIMPVLMLAKNDKGKLVPMWKTIDTYNISEAGDAISQYDLKIVDRNNMSGKHGWLLSWDSSSNKMKWTNEITTDVIKDGTIVKNDFNPNMSFAEIGGSVVAPNNPQFVTTGNTNYLAFDVNGSTYYIELKKLAGVQSYINLGDSETTYINTEITKVADVASVSNLTWNVPSGVELKSGQGTNIAVLRGNAYGDFLIKLSGKSTNDGTIITDEFYLKVVDAAWIDAQPAVTVSGSPLSTEKSIRSSNVSGITWTANSNYVIITDTAVPSSNRKKIRATSPGTYTITVSGTSTVSGNPISDTFTFTAQGSGTSGGSGGGGSSSNPCYCFKEGTLIDTTDGKKTIESVTEGDKVYSFDLDNKKLVLSTVNKRLIHKGNPNKSLRVTLVDGTELYVTDNHPIYNINSKDYKPIGEFTINDRLININGKVIEILKIEQVADFGITYNLSLDGNLKNYFANGILVHNKDASDCDFSVEQGGCWQYDNLGNQTWSQNCSSNR